MGIPIVDLFATKSFASVHPVLTSLAILALIAIAWFALWISRKFPRHMGKLRLGLLAVYLAVTGPLLWVAFKPQPSAFSLIVESIHQAHQQAAN